MKKLFLYLSTFLFLHSIAFCGTTELMINAEDDKGKRLIKISIPQDIQDGPMGAGLTVVTSDAEKAILDIDGNFLTYTLDHENKIVPRLFLTSLYNQIGTQTLLASVSTKYSRDMAVDGHLPIVKGQNPGDFYIQSDGFIYGIPLTYLNGTQIKDPIELAPQDIHGKFLPSYSIQRMSFFDAVSTFGIVWSVFDMYSKDIQALGDSQAQTKWDGRKGVRIFPHMIQEQFHSLYPTQQYNQFYNNAFYDYRTQDKEWPHVLCFFPTSSENKSYTYTSQSLSVVSHEVGHNVLDILRPELRQSSSTNHDRVAFHETFGDITALFATLQFPELRISILETTKGNLHSSSSLSVIGKDIANRDATQCTTLSVIPSCEQHELSERLTRAIYGTFADFFNGVREDSVTNLGETAGNLESLLEKTTTKFKSIFLKATLNSKLDSFISFGRDFRNTAEKNSLLYWLIHTNFLRQGIDLSDELLSPQICSPSIGALGQASLECATRKIKFLTEANR